MPPFLCGCSPSPPMADPPLTSTSAALICGLGVAVCSLASTASIIIFMEASNAAMSCFTAFSTESTLLETAPICSVTAPICSVMEVRSCPTSSSSLSSNASTLRAAIARTGLCRFGATCRFNHPANRKLAIANAIMKGEYPERPGQPECQYYLKTGTCKFGATCKFHHPKDKAGIAGRVSLNILGYPLRPDEVECAYYLRTGQCKFGSTCKFHHPQPSNLMVPLRGSVYASVQAPTTLGQQSYGVGVAGWPRASFIPSPRWQGSSSYAPVFLHQSMVSVPGWNTYTSQLASAPSSENWLETVGSSQVYGTMHQSDSGNAGSLFSPDYSGSLSAGSYALQKENIFPERPGQPECQFYMKTGDCKFGAVCKFHHPRERSIPPPDCTLSPMGLPLRPGEPLCIFYSRYGICKFGPSCKFDHPMGILAYDFSGSSLANPAAQRYPMLSSEGLVGKVRRLSLSETRQMPSGDDVIDTDE